MAYVLHNQGRYEKAVQIYNDVFEKTKIILRPDHSDTLKTMRDRVMVGIIQKLPLFFKSSTSISRNKNRIYS